MVAVISSSNLGIFTVNGSGRGTPGSPGNGTADGVYVNTSTGNLVLQSQDESLAAVGLDLNLVRTYNSQGLMDDDNGDNWRLGIDQRVYGLSGTVNTEGSTVRKVFGDGADVLYTYSESRGAYVSTEGDGADDTLTFSGGTWTWTEGSSQRSETYNSSGKLTGAHDADSNSVTYAYNLAGLLTTITDASGQVTTLVYSGTDLTEISVSSGGSTQIRTHYTYDDLHRLSQVLVDLTPTNGVTLVDANSDGLYETVDSQTYVTTYTYEDDSKRISSITHGDGTAVSFGYTLIDADYRVTSVTDGVGRTTLFDYEGPIAGPGSQNASANPATLSTTDLLPQSYERDDGVLTTPVQGFNTASLMESATGAANDPQIQFDANGNGIALWRVGGDVLVRRYNMLTDTWSAEQVIDSRTNTVSAPSLSVDSTTGNAIAAWVQSNGTANSTYASRYNAATNTWSAAVLLETSTAAVATASGSLVATTNGTNAAVAWLQGTSNDLYVARWNGTAWSAAQLVESSTNAAAQPSITYLGTSSSILVTWQQSDGTANSIYRNRWNGSSWSGATLVDSSTTAASLPVVRSDASGNAFIAWAEGNNVKVRRYDGTTGTLATEITLDTRTNTVSSPTLAVDWLTGDAVVAWVQSNGTANSAYASTYSGWDNTWSAPVLLESANSAVATAAGSIVAAYSSNYAAVAWVQNNDLYGARWIGASWTAATLLESGSPAAAQPTVTVDSLGNVGVLWQQSDGTASSIYQRRYQNDTTPYYLIPSGATWQSIAADVYGIDSPEAASAAQEQWGDPPLIAGTAVYDPPQSLWVPTEVTVPDYYTVQSEDTWESITQAIYGTDEPSAVSALQAVLDSPELTDGVHLVVPLTLVYGVGSLAYDTTYVTDPLGYTTSYLHDGLGRLTATISPTMAGVFTVNAYAYNDAGHLGFMVEDAGGAYRLTTFDYDDNGNLTRTQDAAGNTTFRAYSDTNRLLTETVYRVPDVGGAPSEPLTSRYVYDTDDRLRFAITPEGRVTEYRYNGLGQRVNELIYGEAVYDLLGFDEYSTPTLTEMTSWASGHVDTRLMRTDYTYDFRGQVSSATAYRDTTASGAGIAAGSSKTQYVYDQRGQLLQTITPRGSGNTPNASNPNIGYATTFTYDSLGRVLTSTQWIDTGVVVQNSTNFYDDAGNNTVITTAGELVTTVQHDAAGRVVSIQNSGPALPGVGTTEYKYDEDGRLRFVIDPTGVIKHQLYDEIGRKVADIDADGSLTEYVYDRENELIKTIRYSDALSASKLALLIDQGEPANVSLETLKEDMASTPETGRERDQITRNVYDSAGRVAYSIDATGAVTRYDYDGASRLVKVVEFAAPVTIWSGVDLLSVEDVDALVDENDPNNRVTRSFYDDDGHLRGTLDAEGYLVELSYDAAGRLQQKTAYATQTEESVRADGALDELRPDLDPDITPESPAQDIVDLFFYDGQGRGVGHLDGEGYLTDTQYDVSGNVSQTKRYDVSLVYGGEAYTAFRDAVDATSAPRHTSTYQYDGANRLILEQSTDGTQKTYGYNAAGDLIRTTEASGSSDERTTQERYDAQGRVIRELSGEGSIALAQLLTTNPGASPTQINDVWNRYGVTYEYDVAGRRISATTMPSDPLNGTQVSRTLYYYDGDGQLRFTVNPAGNRVERTYNALGQVTEEKSYFNELSAGTLSGLTGGLLTPTLEATLSASPDARDASTHYTYELSGSVDTSVTDDGATVVNDYTTFGELYTTTVSDATQNSFHRYTYDKRGLLHETEWNPGVIDRTETREYDAFGRLESTTDQYGNETQTHYDRLGRTLESFDALGNRQGFTYDAFSRTRRVYDAYNQYTQYDYDDVNRIMTVTTPEGIVVTTQYTRNGQTLSVTAAGNTTSYTYDDDGNVKTISDNLSLTLGALETREYDTEGRQIKSTDGRNVVTRLAYDAADRVLTRTVETDGDPLVTAYEYDGEGRVKKVTEPGNKVTTTTYYRDGSIKDVIVDPGTGSALNLTTHYEYDAVNHTVTVTEGYQGGGPTAPRIVRYAYDAQGRRISETVLMQDPLVQDLTTQYFYDANDNLTRKIDAANNSTWYVYDADQRLTFTMDALGGVTESIYDNDGRVIGTRRYANAMDASAYAATDRISGLEPVLSGDDRLQQSVYDRDGRERYSIDAMGTVTQRTYDANGNVIRNRTFAQAVSFVDGLNRPALFAQGVSVTDALTAVENALTSANNSLTSISLSDRVEWAAYDVRGQRVLDINGLGYATRYQYDAAGNLEVTTQYATALIGSIPDNVTGLTAAAGGLTATGPGGTTNLTLVTDAAHDRVTHTWYDAVSRVRFVLNAEGYLTETRYADSTRSRIDITYAAQNIVTGSEDTAGVAAAVSTFAVSSNILNEGKTTQFDAAGRVFRVYDSAGVYDESGQPVGAYEEYGYDAVGNKITFQNKKGAIWHYQYDANQRLIEEITPEVAYTVLDHSTTGLSVNTSLSGTGSIHTRFAYDNLGNVRLRSEAYGTNQQRDTEYQYDALGRQTVVVYPLATGSTAPTTVVTYDTLGNAISSVDVAGSYAHKGYDALGRVSWELDSERHLTAYQYDAFGNVTEARRLANAVDDATGPSASALRPSIDLAALISSDDRVLIKRYDRLNRAYEIETGTTDRYDPVARSVYLGSSLTSYQYSAFDQVIVESTALNASQAASTYSYYDRRGLKVAQVDAKGYLTTYEYHDSTGDLTRQVEYAKPVTGTVTTSDYGTVNPSPAQTNFNDEAGYDRVTEYGYDVLNRKTSEMRVGVVQGNALGGLSVGNQLTTFGYDLLGNQTRITQVGVLNYNTSSQIWLQSDANTYTYYDVLGRIIGIAEPVRDRGDGTNLIPYTAMRRDVFGNLVEQTQYAGGATSASETASPPTPAADLLGQNRVSHMLYDAHGNVIQTEDPTGADRFSAYDESGRLMQEWQPVTNSGDGTAETISTTYEYDSIGQQLRVIEPLRSGGEVVTKEVTYNAFGEVLTRTTSGISGGETYEYDGAGNVWRTNAEDGVYKIYLYDRAGNATLEIKSRFDANASVDLHALDLDPTTDDLRTVVGMTGTITTETIYDELGRVIARQEPSLTPTTPVISFDPAPAIVFSGSVPHLAWTDPVVDPTLHAALTIDGVAVSVVDVDGSESGYRPGGSLAGRGTGTHSYQITYSRAGDSLPVYAASGTFYLNLEGTSTTTVDLTALTTLRQISSVTADGTSFSWTADQLLNNPALELLIGGVWTPVTGVTHQGTTYSVPLTGLATANYQYRITAINYGRVEAVARGTLSYTAAVTVPITTTTISPVVDPSVDVGTVTVVGGSTLQWTGVLFGDESGVDLQASIQLQQGGTVLNPTVSYTDSGSTRTFSVSLPTLGAGSWTYTITHTRFGTVVGAATGTVSSTGTGSIRSVSGAAVSAGSAPPAATQITGISAHYSGSNVLMAWSASSDTRITSVVQLSTDGVNWGTSYTASLTTDESSGAYLFAVTLPGTAGNYYYRITNTALGQTLATATGTLEVTAGNVINTTTMSIYPTAQDPGTPVGNVTASGSTLNWSGSLTGNEAGYELTAQIVVTQGGTQYTRTATYTDAGSTRNFSINLGDLGAGTWNYTISHIRNGAVIGAKSGTFVTSGVSTPRQISSVSVSPNAAIPSPPLVGTLSTSIDGSGNTTVSWAAPSSSVTATFEIANQGAGNWQSYNATLNGGEGGYTFSVGFNKPATTYDYRITLRSGSQVLTVATGTMTITAASSSTSTAATGYTPSAAWAAVGPISASATSAPQATGSVVSSTYQVWDPVYNEFGQQTGQTPRWAGSNTVNLSWNSTGGANVNVVVAYRNATGQDTSVSWNGGWVSGGQFSWGDSVPGNGTFGNGGLSYINYVAVYDSSWNLIRYSGYTYSTTTLSWGGVSGPAPMAYLQYKVAGTSTWSGPIYATLSGSSFSVGAAFLSNGTYDYSITQFTDGNNESGGTTSTATGQFVVSGSSAYIASQSGTPAYLSGVSASGSYLYWNYNPQAGDSITVTLNGGAYSLTPVPYGGGNYYASFYGVPSGTYNYSIQYTRAGVAYLLGTGTVGISTTVTPIPATVSASTPSNTQYSIADIVPTASADTLSWSYGAMGGVTTAATLIYSINGGAQQTVNYSGPGSFAFSQVTGNQNATITYEITYRRTDTGAVYAFGSGTYYFTVTTPTIYGSLSSVTQADVYPTVPGITNLVDRGSGLLSWDGSSSGGTVQVRYRQPPTTGTWSSWQPATAYGAGYSFNFNSLTGWVEYDIEYVVSGQNPYRRAAGQIFVEHTSQTIPPDAIESQPTSHAEYAVANVVPTAAGSTSDTFSWSYPTGGVSTTVTVNYSINGVAQTPLTYSGPGSLSLSAVTGNQSAAIAYTITYRRNDNSLIYAQGTGSFNFTVTTTAVNSTLTAGSQTPVYPSVPGVTNLTDRGNGVMSWEPASSGGAVEVRYRQPPTTGTWSSWTPAQTYGSTGYSFDFNAFSNQLEYEIRYVISGQDPYRRATGVVTVTHGYQIITPASASVTGPTNGTAITGFTDLGGGYFGWLTGPATGSDTMLFEYRTAGGADNWVVPALTPELVGGYYRVYLGNLSGGFEFQVEYRTSGETVAYAVGDGLITVTTNPDVIGSNFVDTSISYAGPGGPKQSQTLDRWGNVISVTDRATQTTHYRYNQASQLVATIQAPVSIVDVAGRDEDNEGAITTGAGTPTSYNYFDAYGRLVATRDANDNVNSVAYNIAGQLVRQKNADGTFKSFINDIFGDQISITDEEGYRTRQAFDKAGRLTRVAREVAHNAFGATTPETIPGFLDANVIVKRYEYDEAGRRILETTGEQTHASNVGTGQEQTIRYWYDLQGNLSRMRAISGGEMSFTFDAMGRKIADPGNSKTWTYDYFGHVTAHTDLGGAIYTYVYDTNTWLLKYQTNDRGLSQTYSYNEANLLTSIVDNPTSIARTTEYQYDAAGRLARELITVGGTLYQDTRTEYDALGRIQHLSGLEYNVDYEYDAAGNRTHIHATYTSSFGTDQQDLWYQYDAMNRVTVSQGVNDSGVIAIDTDNTDFVTQGTILYYDNVGNRIESVSYSDGIYRSGALYTNAAGNNETHYEYDGVGRLTNTRLELFDESGQQVVAGTILVDSRTYDRTSRVTNDKTWTVDSTAQTLVAREQITVYSDDGLAQSIDTKRTDPEDSAAQLESHVLYGSGIWGSESGYDAAGNVIHYQVNAYDKNGQFQYTSDNDISYDKYESYVERVHSVSNSSTIENGRTERIYNVNGELIQIIDDKGADSYFVNNVRGQAILSVKGEHGAYGSEAANTALQTARAATNYFDSHDAGYFFFSNTGDYVGSVTALNDVLKANFDVNFTPISPQYPSSVPSKYVVQRGDTLRIIAARIFGDAKLWYIIAEANGLSDPDASIPEGRELTIPNQVVSLSNDASTFKPFSVSDALGDTSPTQPAIPPPRHGGGCGIIGMIIVIIVAIVVTALTEGSTTEFWASLLESMGASETAAASAAIVLDAATAAAIGSAASQVVGIAIGVQDKFSWKNVAVAALSAGLTKAGGINVPGIQNGGTAGDIFNQALQGVVNNAVGQGINIAVGVQDKFNWRELAIAAVSAPLTHAIGESVADDLKGIDRSTFGGDFAVNLISRGADALGTAVVRLALGGKVDVKGVTADVFGHALGDSIVNTMSEPAGPAVPATGAVAASDEALEEVQVTARKIGTNTGAISQVSASSPDDQRNSGAYTVQRGDSLFRIAQRELGDGNLWPEIAKLNGIDNPNLIQPGVSLQIPDSTGIDVAATRKAAGEFYQQDAAARAVIDSAWQESVDEMTTSSFDLITAATFDRMLRQSMMGANISGIVPMSRVGTLPNAVDTIQGMPSVGAYQIVEHHPVINGQLADVPSYYTAYNNVTKTDEYALGSSDDVATFVKNPLVYELTASMERAPAYMKESWAFVDSVLAGDAGSAGSHFLRSYGEAFTDPGWLLDMGTSIAGGSLAKAASLRALTRERVLGNIAETRAGNATSNFGSFVQNEGRVQEALDIWPPNYGRLGPVETVELQPGELIDRYGLPRGKFTSPLGTPFEDRALPSSYATTKPYFQYEVVKPIPGTTQSRVLPWFGQRGLGTQYELPKSVQWYLDNGYLRKK